LDGEIQWEFNDTNVLASPYGITTDNNNNIYVVGERSKNVVVISPDEQSYKVFKPGLPLLLTDRGNPGLLYNTLAPVLHNCIMRCS
jgi:DNA-binding beta-propeller fold protein YncE